MVDQPSNDAPCVPAGAVFGVFPGDRAEVPDVRTESLRLLQSLFDPALDSGPSFLGRRGWAGEEDDGRPDPFRTVELPPVFGVVRRDFLVADGQRFRGD